LPVFGNNDLLDNYQVPGYGEVSANEYWKIVHEKWFQQPDVASQTNTTFLEGGWFEYKIDSKLSVIGLNTILFNANLIWKSQTYQQNLEMA
jgi:hypothetical protein